MSFVAQVLGGLGGGANSAASMALISSMDPADREKNIGINEAAFGIGMLAGPMIGAGLYSFGGY